MNNNNSKASNRNRIAKNTLMLYFRHILIMLVSLYTVRVILNTLGVQDYGIYNVVGGVVAMFSFFNSTMASASQRFFSFAIGEKNSIKLNKTFAVNWLIYGIIALVALILLETIGLWFIYNKLAIPTDRFEAALWIYHFSVLTFLCSILTTPFMAMIIAHEDMNIYAYISIFEALIKLGVVYLLIIFTCDKLVLYGILTFLATLFSSSIYVLISKKKYKECKFKFLWDKNIFKEVFSFTGWSVFGSITVVLRNQAVTILLNQLFNPIVVAARTIAMQVSNTVNVFSNNFNTGLYPPIIKSYAANDTKFMLSLIFKGSKITYSLMFLVTLPFFLETPYIMNLWLKNTPENLVIFTRLALIDSLITSVSLPLMTAVRATGKVKIYELSLGSILILSFFTSWGILYSGAPAYSVMIVAIVATVLMFIFRLFLLRNVMIFPIKSYLYNVILPLTLMSILSSITASFLSFSIPNNFLYTTLSILWSILSTCFFMYFIIIDKKDRIKIQKSIINNVNKIIK